jgi:hypothetical protein
MEHFFETAEHCSRSETRMARLDTFGLSANRSPGTCSFMGVDKLILLKT